MFTKCCEIEANVTNKIEKNEYERFFNDDVVLGYVLEKTHLRKFILKLIIFYHNRLIDLDKML